MTWEMLEELRPIVTGVAYHDLVAIAVQTEYSLKDMLIAKEIWSEYDQIIPPPKPAGDVVIKEEAIFLDPEIEADPVIPEVDPLIDTTEEFKTDELVEEVVPIQELSEEPFVPPSPIPGFEEGQAAIDQPLDQKTGGLSAGGMFALLIFVSMLLYTFRKCREMINNQPQPYKPTTHDHLNQLL